MRLAISRATAGLFLLISSACSNANSEHAPNSFKLVAQNGEISDEQFLALSETWPQETQDAILDMVFRNGTYRVKRPCSPDGVDSRFFLKASGLRLPGRTKGDLTCALAEAGYVIIGARSTAPERQSFAMVTPDAEIIEIEAQIRDDRVLAITAVRNPKENIVELWRPAPPDRSGSFVAPRDEVYENLRSSNETMQQMQQLIDGNKPELSIIGVGIAKERAESLAEAIEREPGCAQTGKCEVQPCSPMPRTTPLLRAAFFDAKTKQAICESLADWRTRRHSEEAPGDRTAQRALVLAIQEGVPEANLTEGLGRVVIEHSKNGYRMMVFSDILQPLLAGPRMHLVVKEASVTNCKKRGNAYRCAVKVTVQGYQRAVNLPSSVQKVILESFGAREYEKTMTIDFERHNARWELADSAGVIDRMTDWAANEVNKNFVDYFIRDAQQLQSEIH